MDRYMCATFVLGEREERREERGEREGKKERKKRGVGQKE